MNKISILVLVLDIQLVVLLSLVVFRFQKDSRDKDLDENIPVQIQDVLGTEISVSDPVVSICVKDYCTDILKSEVFSNEKIDQTKLNSVVLEKVFPFFEEKLGGKALASSPNGSFVYWKNDHIPDWSNIYEDVSTSFDNGITRIDVQLKDLPGTNGGYAEKYIEVDNSKQELYVWKNGEMIKTIKLSAAKIGYQVYGVYPIIDKGIDPQAPSGRYMPYWMAFYYSKPQASWWGLHGLVWWYDSNGNPVYESEGNIGIRRSGGCIRMLKDDAKYLYDMFDKGDLILLHE